MPGHRRTNDLTISFGLAESSPEPGEREERFRTVGVLQALKAQQTLAADNDRASILHKDYLSRYPVFDRDVRHHFRVQHPGQYLAGQRLGSLIRKANGIDKALNLVGRVMPVDSIVIHVSRSSTR